MPSKSAVVVRSLGFSKEKITELMTNVVVAVDFGVDTEDPNLDKFLELVRDETEIVQDKRNNILPEIRPRFERVWISSLESTVEILYFVEENDRQKFSSQQESDYSNTTLIQFFFNYILDSSIKSFFVLDYLSAVQFVTNMDQEEVLNLAALTIIKTLSTVPGQMPYDQKWIEQRAKQRKPDETN